MERKQIGNIIRGSLLDGLDMKLLETVPLESIKAGKFLVIEGQHYDFFFNYHRHAPSNNKRARTN